MFSVYILWSDSLHKYYVGHTDNLSRRLEEHNTGRSGYTKLGIPWKLMFHEEFETRGLAARRELEIKRRKSKRFIQSLISKNDAGSERPVTILYQ